VPKLAAFGVVRSPNGFSIGTTTDETRPMGEGRLARASAFAVAVARVNRVPTTAAYNVAYVLVGVGLGGVGAALAAPGRLAALVGAATLAKLQASVADAVHDRDVDAANPAKSPVARAVDRLGRRRALSLLVVELICALVLAGYLTNRTGDPVYLAGTATVALLGFWYSYPPRLKERDALNHLVTTGVDVAFVVLAVPYLLRGTLTYRAVAVGAVVFAYGVGYHVVHQAADAYHDREADVSTFALRVGVARSLAYAAGATAAAGLVAAALGLLATVVVTALVTVAYCRLYLRTRYKPLRDQTAVLAERFSVARVATATNGAVAADLLLLTPGPG
jgi:4-hydroxybenzoate polyprenyltransferase